MKLATVEKILDIQPIEGADKIALATILGWQVVIKKEEFKVGDWCVYIPIDTLVNPEKPWFNFLTNPKDPSVWHRVKTSKIRGVYSQGLVIPTHYFDTMFTELTEGLDVGELVDVKKYEKENILNADGTTTRGVQFPTDIIPITDEDNLKSKYQALEELKNKKLYITLKMDGSSMTVIRLNDKFTVCSRRLILESGAVMYQYVEKIGLKQTLDTIGKNIAIQGEFCGPKINCNHMGLKDYAYYIFTIKDLDTNRYYGVDEIKEFCAQSKLDHVPIVKYMEPDETQTIDISYFQQLSNEQIYIQSNGKKVPGEGIVIRPCIPVFSQLLGKSLSVKVINQNYKD